MPSGGVSLIVCAALLFPCVHGRCVSADSTEAMDKARMDAAIHFAETVLKYGRDTYGKKHTPLFTDALDVDTMRAPEKIYICHLIGNPFPRRDQPWQPVVSSNLSYQCNLMRFLAGLSHLNAGGTAACRS